MANYREIVTKSIIGKGKKTFSNSYTLIPEETPTTILGCWVINHKFKGYRKNENIILEGTCDVNVWYAYDNDTQTIVSKQNISYEEVVNVNKKRESDISDNEEIIVRSLRQPNCIKVDIVDGKIEYDIEKELGVEIVGDTKVRIAVDEDEDEWDEIVDEKEQNEIMKEIDENVDSNFLSKGEKIEK